MKLIQLPNGAWVNPDLVTAIIPRADECIFDQSGTLQAVIGGQQCVDVHHVEVTTIYAKANDTAWNVAEEIAGLIREATTNKPIDVAVIERDYREGHAAHFAATLQAARNEMGGGKL